MSAITACWMTRPWPSWRPPPAHCSSMCAPKVSSATSSRRRATGRRTRSLAARLAEYFPLTQRCPRRVPTTTAVSIRPRVGDRSARLHPRASQPPRDRAVHVALAVEGTAGRSGAVALPSLGVTLSTASPPVLPQVESRPPRILVSRTRPSEHAELLATHMRGELVPMGSAGAKAMAVVRGEADIYAHSGGQYEWDSAAPVAVAVAAGGCTPPGSTATRSSTTKRIHGCRTC